MIWSQIPARSRSMRSTMSCLPVAMVVPFPSVGCNGKLSAFRIRRERSKELRFGYARAMPEPALRASDDDRNTVLQALEWHTAAGRLSLEEFDQRSTAALAAVTQNDLAPLIADLPDPPAEPTPQRPPPGAPPRPPAPPPPGQPRSAPRLALRDCLRDARGAGRHDAAPPLTGPHQARTLRSSERSLRRAGRRRLNRQGSDCCESQSQCHSRRSELALLRVVPVSLNHLLWRAPIWNAEIILQALDRCCQACVSHISKRILKAWKSP